MISKMGKDPRRDTGTLVFELVAGIALFTVGVLGALASFQASVNARDTAARADHARLALENVAELLRRSEFRELYGVFDGALIEAPNLKGEDESPAQIEVTCFVNELAVPPDFGPLLDIDGRGGLENGDCSVTYRILPVRLRLTYGDRYGTNTRELYMIVAPPK